MSGFPLPDRVEDKLRWNDILKIILITLSFWVKIRTEPEYRSAFTKLDFKQHLVLNLDKIWKFKKLRSPFSKRLDPEVTWLIGRNI